MLEVCSSFRQEDSTVALTPDVEAGVLGDVERLADEGYRVLAFARRELPGPRFPRPSPDAGGRAFEW